jgi:DNA polymerase
MVPSYKKSLQVLYDEWKDCSACALGEQRIARNGHFVFGTGTLRSIMFIGEGPGDNEEQAGQPFCGKSGTLLRSVLKALQVEDFYLTNLVACRSCSPQVDAAGQPVFFQRRRGPPRQMFRDEPPTTSQVKACLPRLQQEIYLVDPVVIVGLGAESTRALAGSGISITKERGDDYRISIPGAHFKPVLTGKKEWAHGRKDALTYPVEQGEVDYLFIPTLHPAYVLRKKDDKDIDSPYRQFVTDVRKAARVYEEYLKETHGIRLKARETPYTIDDIVNISEQALDDE